MAYAATPPLRPAQTVQPGRVATGPRDSIDLDLRTLSSVTTRTGSAYIDMTATQTLELCTTCNKNYGLDGPLCGLCASMRKAIASVPGCTICGTGAPTTSAGVCAACWTPPPTPPVERKRPDWDSYFFDMARLVATRATCPRASIGCVIVRPEGHLVMGTGYNGAFRGKPHCTATGCEILADHCVTAIHAEENAADQVAEHLGWIDAGSWVGLVAYVVGPRNVCSHCAKVMYEVGVREVKWKSQ